MEYVEKEATRIVKVGYLQRDGLRAAIGRGLTFELINVELARALWDMINDDPRPVKLILDALGLQVFNTNNEWA